MWCPSVSLSLWANAWLAGQASPDDILDALSLWAPRHSVAAYDAVAGGRTGLPWPDLDYAGAVSLLQTIRKTTARRSAPEPAIGIVAPVAGDVRGLPAGTQFEREALTAGEAVIIAAGDKPGAAVGLVPDFEYGDPEQAGGHQTSPDACALSWTVYAVAGRPVLPAMDQLDLGESEYALRSAVRSAAETLDTIGMGSAGGTGSAAADPRELVEQMVDSSRRHRVPDHAPSRALRVLENAAHVEAIIAVGAGLSRLPGSPPQAGGGTSRSRGSTPTPGRETARIVAGLAPIGTQSSFQAQLATNALGPLAAVVRSARLAAVSAILHSAWRG